MKVCMTCIVVIILSVNSSNFTIVSVRDILFIAFISSNYHKYPLLSSPAHIQIPRYHLLLIDRNTVSILAASLIMKFPSFNKNVMGTVNTTQIGRTSGFYV